MRQTSLVVWMNGERVGTWRRLSDNDEEFSYDRQWIDSPNARPISLSLPFSMERSAIRSEAVKNFFENLLPENETLRQHLARRFNVRADDAFSLLNAIGRDCIGAIQILPPTETPDSVEAIEATELTEHDIAERLRGSVNPEGSLYEFNDEDFRISLAGVQSKIALLKHNGKWFAPRGATPTTHILKMPMGRIGPMQADFSDSVDNEWLCLKLGNVLGLDCANATIEIFEDQRVLVVERFDRRLSADQKRILRLHQEDFCQALGLPPSLKYESDGGPGAFDVLAVLRQSEQSQKDLDTFLLSLVYFWLLRATDGHAKNYSIMLLSQNRYRLAKLYDIVSTWPAVGNGPHQLKPQQLKFAMALEGKRRHYRMERISVHNFAQTAASAGLSERYVSALIEDFLKKVPSACDALSNTLPKDFSKKVADKIFAGVLKSSQELLSEINQ